ncbi:hypothetical protein TeGR_g6204 [Tetraparma gracilis]|uniref:MYND-type domain-containing protein n=1 Tax=Tetraparma gracilis TaxID=2962635 RepID=A0ABQ6MN11_9STRA|nr:hypothetical protein TeGR_g6204 [Tetraparma gracilis]
MAPWYERCVQLVRSIESGQRLADAILTPGEMRSLGMTAINDDNPPTALLLLCGAPGDCDTAGLVRRLVAAGADVNVAQTYSETGDDLTPLRVAVVRRDKPDIVEILLRAGADTRTVDAKGSTPLHTAVDSKRVECIQLLMEAGADANAFNDNGYTPLSRAVSSGFAAGVSILLQGGGNANQQIALQDTSGRRNVVTLITIAAVKGYYEITKALAMAGARLDVVTTNGASPLIGAAQGEGGADVVDYLLGAGAAVDATDEHGRTALHFAVQRSCLPAVVALLQGGADPNVATKTGIPQGGRAPLSLAARAADLEMCEALVDAGADVDNACDVGETAFMMAVSSADVALVRYFVEVAGADIHAANTRTGSPFHLMVNRPPRGEGVEGASMEVAYLRTLQYLLGLGVYDVSAPDPKGWSPLHNAVSEDRLVFVALLLEHGADVGAKKVHTGGAIVTPIMCAKSEGVEKLLRKKLRVDRCGYSLCDGGVAEGGKLQGCSLCNRVFYCSKACQRAHWREHKKECGVSWGRGQDRSRVIKLPSSKQG